MDVSKHMFLCMLINVCFFLPSKSLEDPELQFVQILFRHGDRAPITLYPTDPNPENVWVEGLGKLSMLGRRQHYALGKLLRKMYGNFTTTSPNEIAVQSSDCDRCMKSAETNLASFYAPNSQWKFEKNVDWQPLSVHYIPKENDRYLETDSYCPSADKELIRIVQSPEGQNFIRENKEMFDYLMAYSGASVTNWTSASHLFDTLFIEDRYNLTIPLWATTYWDQLKNVSGLSFYWSFNSPLLLRLRAGPLLGRTIEKMKLKISGDLPEQKIQIYSAHDTNVAVVLNALEVFNMKQPPYCATLLLELYKVNSGHAVRLLFLNSSTPELGAQNPQILILNGCTEFCPLDYFENYTRHLIPEDWENECQLKQSLLEQISEASVTTGLIFATVAIVLVMMCSYGLWRWQHRGREKYSYHLMAPLTR